MSTYNKAPLKQKKPLTFVKGFVINEVKKS